MTEHPAPAWLSPEAKRAFARIKRTLKAKGAWDELYVSTAAVAADGAADYCRYAATPGFPPDELESMRVEARRFLAEFWVWPEGREHVASITPDGRDAELFALCQPLKE